MLFNYRSPVTLNHIINTAARNFHLHSDLPKITLRCLHFTVGLAWIIVAVCKITLRDKRIKLPHHQSCVEAIAL